jgi:hypothetical protein
MINRLFGAILVTMGSSKARFVSYEYDAQPALSLAPFGRWTLRDRSAAPVSLR